jgi:replicative DNA helicase
MKEQKLKYSNSTELPNNFLAEQSILNILILNPSLITTAIENLKEESFYFEPHKIIYSIICELKSEKKIVTLTTLMTVLQDRALLSQIGGVEIIISIVNRFETFSNLQEYIKLVNEKYLRRLIIELGKQTIVSGYTTSSTLPEVLIQIENNLSNVNQQTVSQKVYTASEIVDDVFLDITAKIKNNENPGILTTYKDLDSVLQGFQKSDLVIIAGRPSMGKTAFALNLGKNVVSKYKIPLVVFSLEMSRQQIIYRFLSNISQINSSRLKSGKMTSQEWKLLSQSMKELSELPIFVEDSPNLTINDIRSTLRKIFQGSTKQGLVIIDYLQLMKTTSKIENRAQEISEVTRSLKILAKEFEVPIILLSQLSRNVESRVNKRPLLSDLRESGSIEQDADIVVMLYRDDYYTNQPTKLSLTEFIVAKHRNGPVGTAKLNFNPTTTTFTTI